jgi:NADH-ubiquinone oxidoreductase chain 4
VFLYTLLIIPIIGIFFISSIDSFTPVEKLITDIDGEYLNKKKLTDYKKIAFIASILNLIISLIIYILFDFSNNQFQFIQEHYDLSFYDIYLGVDGISIYFVLLTTIIMPIALISN